MMDPAIISAILHTYYLGKIPKATQAVHVTSRLAELLELELLVELHFYVANALGKVIHTVMY